MADFLTRLAERALGLAPTVEPVIAPRFAPGPGFEPEEQEPMPVFEEQSIEPPRQDDAASRLPDPPALRNSPFAPAPLRPEPEPAAATEESASSEATRPQPMSADVRIYAPDRQSAPLLPLPEAPTVADISSQSAGMSQVSAPIPTAPIEPLPQAPQAQNVGQAQSIQERQAVKTILPYEAQVTVDTIQPRPRTEGHEPLVAEEPAPGPIRPLPVHPVAARPQVSSPPERAAGRDAPADESGPPPIRVTIGRVEVRAVFPPPRPKAEPAKSGPALSLEDYLKQRSGGTR
ncbi:MAG: hypothetical protein IT210_13330 [Armatimonadetes bacterium]|nr:hypothetical protein [Armatimonadota bacterium]